MSATDTSSRPCWEQFGRSWFRRNNNEPEDFGVINASPWQPTLQHACFLTFWSLVVPFFSNFLFMAAEVWTDLQDHVESQSVHNLHNVTQVVSKVRVRPDLFRFAPLVLIACCVITFFYFSSFALCNNSTWLRAVEGLCNDFVEVCCHLSQVLCCSKRVSGGEASQSRCSKRVSGGEASGSRPRLRSSAKLGYALGSAIFAAVLPWVAWSGPLFWWRDAAAQFRTCHRVCRFDQSVNMEAYAEVCVEHMKVHPVFPSEDLNLNSSHVGEREAQLCMEIMNNTATSKYTDHVLSFGHTFLAFESNLRQHYGISCVEIFGSVLDLGLVILVLSARAALWEQFRTLRLLRVQFIKNYMLQDVDGWVLFFEMLGQHGSWTHVILKEVRKVVREEAPPEKKIEDILKDTADDSLNSVKKKIEDILKDTEDDSLNGVNDCSACFSTWGPALFCAVVDALIPILSRCFFSSRAAGFGSSADSDPVALEHFHFISSVSAFVTFMGTFSSFFLLSSAFVRNKSQIKAVMAFDGIFRLPWAHPQPPSTLSSNNGVQMYNEGRYFYALTTFGEMDNKENLKKFAFFFFHGREYLQLDKVDERHSLETAMVVAFLGLVPRTCIVLCNVLLEAGQRRTVQPVNAAWLWRLGFVSFVSFFSLLQSMRLNEHFGKHRERLEILVPRSQSLYMQRQHDAAAAGAVPAPPEAPDNRVEKVVPALIEVMDSHESPSTLFGFKVRYSMLLSFLGVCTISLPELVGLFSALIEHLANV